MGFLYPELDAPPSTNPTLHVLPSQCVQHHGASVFSAGKGKTTVRKKASLKDRALRNLIVNFLFIMNYFQDRALNVLQVLTNFLLVHPILEYSFNLEIVRLIGGSFAARLLSCFRCWPRGCSLCSRWHSSTVSLTSTSSPRLNELLLRLPSVILQLGCFCESISRERCDFVDPDSLVVRCCIVLCGMLFYCSLVPSARKRCVRTTHATSVSFYSLWSAQNRKTSDMISSFVRFILGLTLRAIKSVSVAVSITSFAGVASLTLQELKRSDEMRYQENQQVLFRLFSLSEYC